MRLRTVVVALFTGAVALLFTFILLTATIVWNYLAPLLPSELLTMDYLIPTHVAIQGFGMGLLILLLLVMVLFTLLFNRLIAAPLVGLTSAMALFTENRSLPTLPRLSSITELRELSQTFIAFTNSVEALHSRDTEISRVKSDFISTAAHQLRTPLTGIRWALEALMNEPLNENQRTLVASAQGKIKDLVGIVGTLLDISSIESGKHPYVFTSVQLPSIAAGIVSDMTHLAEERKVTMRHMLPETELPLVRADQQQITWVLTNLIENAIRYTPADGSVTISYAQAPGRVQVLVQDTGIGIPEQDRNNIFERFYRAPNAIAKENGGNGLGLYIARTIATDHGGDLNFDNNKNGQGTVFSLSLPTVMGTRTA